MKARHRLLYPVGALAAVWLVAPTLVVIPLSLTDSRSLVFPPQGYSLTWYEHFFTDPDWVGDLMNSLQIGVLVALLATVIGTLAAYGLMKMKGSPKVAANTVMLLPMLIPGVVFAVGVYPIFLRLGLVGTLPGFLVVHTVLALPFTIVPVSSVLASYDEQLEKAAWISGAGKVKAFFTVTLPAIRAGVIAGALFAFITSFDEVIVSLFISNSHLKTLPVRLYTSMQREVDPTIAAAAVVIMTLSTVVAGIGLLAIAKQRTN